MMQHHHCISIPSAGLEGIAHDELAQFLLFCGELRLQVLDGLVNGLRAGLPAGSVV